MKNLNRQYIAIKFEIDLPLRQRDLNEAIGLLKGVLDILTQAQGAREIVNENELVPPQALPRGPA